MTEQLPPRPSTVQPVEVARLAALVGARLSVTGPENAAEARPPVAVTGVALRAQQIRHGDLFAALPGSTVHGARFAGQAIEAGAGALLTDPDGQLVLDAAGVPAGVPVLVHDRPRAVLGELSAQIYDRPSAALAVHGITGTSGKTTTSYLLDGALRAAGRTTGVIGTVGTMIDAQPLATEFTTPEAPDFQALLALMRERGVSDVAVEVSSHALAQDRVAGTRFATGAFTNLTEEHLDYHADMEDYFAAKARLFDGRAAVEVVCVDDEWGRRLVTPATVTVATTATGTSWWADRVRPDPAGGQAFRAYGPQGLELTVVVRLPGAFNVANALLALACAHAAGVDPAVAARGISGVTVPGRMERIDRGQPFTAVVDYSHKPAALAAVLDAVRAQIAGSRWPEGRVLVVFGCGGDRDRGKRPVMGQLAARRAELVVVTDDNPRGEDPAVIRAQVLAGAMAVPPANRGRVLQVADRRRAIALTVDRARPGDVLVVAGKGHETGQRVGAVTHPFDDRDELASALVRRRDRIQTGQQQTGRPGPGRPGPGQPDPGDEDAT